MEGIERHHLPVGPAVPQAEAQVRPYEAGAACHQHPPAAALRHDRAYIAPVKLSVVIPAHNEAGVIGATLDGVTRALDKEGTDYEILVIDDASTDGTAGVVDERAANNERIRCLRSHYAHGFGFAVRAGLERFEGDAVAIYMADASDDPGDLVLYHSLLNDGYDCAFGSRFVPGGIVRGYPPFKLFVNRIVNFGIRILFRHGYNDTTNAFKAYRREVIEATQPLLSNHFNLTVELPLKAIVRGFSYATVPISWTNRAGGESKLRLEEQGSRYAFIVLYVFLEHHLSRGDYRRPDYVERRHPGHLRSLLRRTGDAPGD
jgi:dolichol-phosphate mannosyltransferase